MEADFKIQETGLGSNAGALLGPGAESRRSDDDNMSITRIRFCVSSERSK
jgi:hypothetical protein